MQKTYKCNLHACSVLVTIDGVTRRIELEPAIITEYGHRGCKYITSDVKEQKAIEADPNFNGVGMYRIWTDDVEPVENHVEEIVELNPDTITTLKEAKFYIVDKFGVDPADVSTKAKVLAFAAEHNFQFKNL